MTLAEFVTARLNEDADYARELLELPGISGMISLSAALLRDVEAKRKILELAAGADDIHYDRCVEVGMDCPPVLIGEQIRRTLAATWSDHPEYRTDWA